MFGAPPSFRLVRLCSTILLDYRATASRKLGRAAEYLIDGREKRICRLSFEFIVRMLLKRAVISFDNYTEG